MKKNDVVVSPSVGFRRRGVGVDVVWALLAGVAVIDFRDRIANAIREAASNQTYWVPGPILSKIYADAVIDLLIDMAGHGELLKAIDRMYRDV